MDKFLELAFKNYVLNTEGLATNYEETFAPLMEFVSERLSKKASGEFSDICIDCMTEALWIAGVLGMELAIGVMNGTIEQTL